ncbi:MAG: trigger factor [Polyangiales bacterium]
MQVTVSRVSPVVVSLRVELPQERVRTEMERAYNSVSREAQIKGFRKGKVPRPLLKQYYGAKIEYDVANRLVNETLDDAIRDSKVETIGAQPKIDAPDPIKENAAWHYVASVEVRPEIGEINYGALVLTKKVYTVDEHDIEHVLDEKREEHSTVQTPEPIRPAQKSDSVTFDWDLLLDGVSMPEFAAKGRTTEIGRGVLFPEVEAGLEGMLPGDVKDIVVTFPESHSRKELAGKSATLRVTVSALQEKVLPTLDDEFAKDVGAESLEALKASIRADLEKKYAEKSDDEVKDEAINLLVKEHEVEVPRRCSRRSCSRCGSRWCGAWGWRARTPTPSTTSSAPRPRCEPAPGCSSRRSRGRTTSWSPTRTSRRRWRRSRRSAASRCSAFAPSTRPRPAVRTSSAACSRTRSRPFCSRRRPSPSR